MAPTFPLGRRASGGYYIDRTRNGHGATHEPSAGLGNPGGGSAARKTPAANASIRDFVEQVARPAKGTGEISCRLEWGHNLIARAANCARVRRRKRIFQTFSLLLRLKMGAH